MGSIVPVSIVIFIRNRSNSGVDLWVQPRESKGSLHGLWEFPGGKIERGEDPKDAAIREVQEEVDFQISETDKLNHFKIHSYTYEGKNISLFIYLNVLNNPPQVFNDRGKWINFNLESDSGFLKGEIPPINHEIIDCLLEYLKKEDYGID